MLLLPRAAPQLTLIWMSTERVVWRAMCMRIMSAWSRACPSGKASAPWLAAAEGSEVSDGLCGPPNGKNGGRGRCRLLKFTLAPGFIACGSCCKDFPREPTERRSKPFGSVGPSFTSNICKPRAPRLVWPFLAPSRIFSAPRLSVTVSLGLAEPRRPCRVPCRGTSPSSAITRQARHTFARVSFRWGLSGLPVSLSSTCPSRPA